MWPEIRTLLRMLRPFRSTIQLRAKGPDRRLRGVVDAERLEATDPVRVAECSPAKRLLKLTFDDVECN
jgi:hypothetical protein